MLGRKPRRRFDDLVRSSVVLHLDEGDSIAGILLAVYDDSVTIARARLLSEATGRMHALDGELVIPLGRIRFAQAGVRIDDTRDLALAPAQGSRGA